MTAGGEDIRRTDGADDERSLHGSGTLVYAYAFARDGTHAGRAPLSEVEGVVPGAPIHLEAVGDLFALVSPLPPDGPDWQGFRASLRDPATAEQRVLAHHRVLATMAPLITLVPLTFGTIFEDAQGLREALERHRAQLFCALDRVAGAAEWSVKLYVDERAISERAQADAPEAVALREQLTTAASGRGFFLRKKLDDLVAQAASERRYCLARQSHECLSAYAREAVSTPVPPTQISDAGDATLALNAVYLVTHDEADAFAAAAAGLEKDHAALGCRCALGGPWPPYSFAKLGDHNVAAD